ncbi:hypothetical protein ACVW0Y_000585 [Pseudomonas sp. TE3786]
MRFVSIVIPFVLVCVISSGITAMVLSQGEVLADKPDQAEVLSAPPGFTATRTASGGGILYQRDEIADLPKQAGTAAFPKAMNLSEQAKCRLSMGQDRTQRDQERVKVTDEYCNQLLGQNRQNGG